MKSLFKKQAANSGLHRQSRAAVISALGAVVALSSPILANAGDTAKSVVESTSVWEKPVWLTDLGLRVGESYDTNVYLGGVAVEPGVDVAEKNKASAVTTISPKIGVDLAKLLDKDSVLKLFTLGYSPDFVIFHDASSETYQAHRFTTAIKAQADPVTVNLENAFTYINGDDVGLLYPGGASAYAQGTIRERRDQWQDRAKASVKVDLGPVFFRPTASLLYYDLGTEFLPGYANFVDRYDLNGGADLGFNVSKTVALTLGYRYGHQEQADLPLDLNPAQRNASSDYQRVLFGVEGSPLKWLKVEASVGPQFTTYTDDRPYTSGVAALGQIDDNKTDVYAEASVTISPTATDALVLKYKRWDWVSSTGINAYVDSLYDASFRHQITKALQLQVGVRASQSDYNPSSLRNDWLYTVSTGFKYTLTKNITLDLSYAYDRGENDQILGNAVTKANVNPSTRQFDRSVVSTGVTWAF